MIRGFVVVCYASQVKDSRPSLEGGGDIVPATADARSASGPCSLWVIPLSGNGDLLRVSATFDFVYCERLVNNTRQLTPTGTALQYEFGPSRA